MNFLTLLETKGELQTMELSCSYVYGIWMLKSFFHCFFKCRQSSKSIVFSLQTTITINTHLEITAISHCYSSIVTTMSKKNNNSLLLYVTEHNKRDHFRQILKTELLVPPYSSYLGLSNYNTWEARSAITMNIQDTKVAPHRK